MHLYALTIYVNLWVGFLISLFPLHAQPADTACLR